MQAFSDSATVYHKIGAIADTEPLIQWCRSQSLMTEYWNGIPTSRLHCWWGKSVRLLNFGKSASVANTVSFDSVLEDLRKQYYPDANSALLYFYRPGASISEHSDKPVFDRRVVLINLVDTLPDLFGEKPATKFRFDGRNRLLMDGDVLQFDSRVRHGVPKVQHHRYSLQLRIVKDAQS